MKILYINSVCGIRSTGRLCSDLAEYMIDRGHEVKVLYGRGHAREAYAIKICNAFASVLHAISCRLFDNSGFIDFGSSKKLINVIETFKPDIVHIHNLHGYYINIEKLFLYLKQKSIRIVWTLHDCWPITGHCAYFDYVRCDKWKTKCHNCPQVGEYPKSIFMDNSKNNYIKKRNILRNVRGMNLVCPSDWLKGVVEQSFLRDYKTHVIHNGVDTLIFKKRKSQLKEKLGINNKKKIILGVAAVWDRRKGLSDFIKLASDEDLRGYQIILIGLSQSQINSLPSHVIGIARTDSEEELARYYSIADVFVNATYEDNYPTTNLESIACGTPVISYETGGSKESAKKFGLIVPKGQLQKLKEAILAENYFLGDKSFVDKKHMLEKYYNLYCSI